MEQCQEDQLAVGRALIMASVVSGSSVAGVLLLLLYFYTLKTFERFLFQNKVRHTE
jgi:hypothetical protein